MDRITKILLAAIDEKLAREWKPTIPPERYGTDDENYPGRAHGEEVPNRLRCRWW
jgi:hypothetical protein